MEGWRQRRLGSEEDHSTKKGNYKIDLTLTGLLMEGLGNGARRVVFGGSDSPTRRINASVGYADKDNHRKAKLSSLLKKRICAE